MTYQGIDIATRIDATLAACLKAAGKSFVVRYLDDTWGQSSKCLNDAERRILHAAGLDVFLVFETCGGAQAPGCATYGAGYFTRSQGIYDAQHAQVHAHDNLKLPDGLPIFFAVDFDASQADLAAMTEYWNGVYDVLSTSNGAYPIGIYGGYHVVKYALDHWAAIKYYWQTVAWSGGQWLPEAQLKQRSNDVLLCGVKVDLDDSTIRGWMMPDAFVTKAEFEAYKAALQVQLDAAYAALGHGHNVSASGTANVSVSVTGKTIT